MQQRSARYVNLYVAYYVKSKLHVTDANNILHKFAKVVLKQLEVALISDIKDKFEDWREFLVRSLTGARTAPSYLLDKVHVTHLLSCLVLTVCGVLNNISKEPEPCHFIFS